MSTPRHHHYVPQGYLRGFADGQGRQARVHCIDLEKWKSFKTNVRNVAGQRDFNRIEVEGVPPDALEKAYADVEGKLVPAIGCIANAKAFSAPRSRDLIFNLMALLAARNPRVRGKIDNFVSSTTKMMCEAMVSTKQSYEDFIEKATSDGYISAPMTTYEEAKNFIKGEKYDIEISKVFVQKKELEAAEMILNTMASRKWVLWLAPEEGQFITCDHPVVLRNTEETKLGPISSPGYGISNTVVVFPLTRKATLVGTFEATEATLDADTTQLANINSIVLSNAENQVYAYDLEFVYRDRNSSLRRGRDLLNDVELRQLYQKSFGDRNQNSRQR